MKLSVIILPAGICMEENTEQPQQKGNKMKDYHVVNKFTGRALGIVRAKSMQVAELLAQAMFGHYAKVET